jgi:hypothetical protein
VWGFGYAFMLNKRGRLINAEIERRRREWEALAKHSSSHPATTASPPFQ